MIIEFNPREFDKTYKIKCIEAMKIIVTHKLLNYVLMNPKCAAMYQLSNEEIKLLKEITGNEES